MPPSMIDSCFDLSVTTTVQISANDHIYLCTSVSSSKRHFRSNLLDIVLYPLGLTETDLNLRESHFMMYQIYLHVRTFLKISLLLVGIYCKLGGLYFMLQAV